VRTLVSYVLFGALVVLALDIIAPPAGFGLAVGARPAIDVTPQVVNRTHKSDKLLLPMANERRKTPPHKPAVLIGCEPVFSSLSAAARVNFAGRCVA
jgi:hypothetical protein